jgi:hypothetical protein
LPGKLPRNSRCGRKQQGHQKSGPGVLPATPGTMGIHTTARIFQALLNKMCEFKLGGIKRALETM